MALAALAHGDCLGAGIVGDALQMARFVIAVAFVSTTLSRGASNVCQASLDLARTICLHALALLFALLRGAVRQIGRLEAGLNAGTMALAALAHGDCLGAGIVGDALQMARFVIAVAFVSTTLSRGASSVCQASLDLARTICLHALALLFALLRGAVRQIGRLKAGLN